MQPRLARMTERPAAPAPWLVAVALRLYSTALWLAQPLLRAKLRRRGVVEAGYLQRIQERFGEYADDLPTGTGWVWVHAVSLGETRAAAILLTSLRQRLPGMRLLLTHGTATGRGEGAKLLQQGDAQVWLPWDTLGATERFLTRFRPRIGLLLETEVWPALTAQCHAQGVPLALVNARMSELSLHKALRLRVLALSTYARLTAVWAQTSDDAQRLRQLCAPVQAVFGNLKFDAEPNDAQVQQGRAWRHRAGRLRARTLGDATARRPGRARSAPSSAPSSWR